ncbi:MAG: hypothetical protein MJZ34_08260 [Paludibacteraceae bacterium]|nr:hypothetical protein [Paludibacteraceae bacterium]
MYKLDEKLFDRDFSKPLDNIEQIRSLLKFEKEGEFYFIEVLRRHKDGHPGCNGNNFNRTMSSFCIYNFEEFDNIIPTIKLMCETFNCRAYIRLNRRSDDNTALRMMAQITAKYADKNKIRKIPAQLHSAIGHRSSIADTNENTRLVDVDWKKDENGKPIIDLEYLKKMMNDIENLNISNKNDKSIGNRIVTVIPSKSGCHIITRGFREQQFRELGYEEIVQPDNPTILYMF